MFVKRRRLSRRSLMTDSNYTHTNDNFTIGAYTTDLDPEGGEKSEFPIKTEWIIPIFI